MIRSLRALLLGRRQRLSAAFLVLLLIVGVALMHAMSGTASGHGTTRVVASASVSSGHHESVSPPATGDGWGAASTAPGAPDRSAASAPAAAGLTTTASTLVPADVPCDDGCGHHHDMVTAMCLMVLAVLLVLTLPGARGLLLAESAWPRAGAWLADSWRRWAEGPSLHALGISRT
ncbi:hypothetical protein ATJ88_0152 [Isoptericola jiangsuensis]|uniref:Uncharacterized protein n=1 Tax=Isoptericola jiangsuensis TaxID=548579 RepID=A0A2A9ETB0_9MICO|nr:hypothetical protein [Isoptericola jiangsuensis]PFG41510.1 hypothetical protein ATJ88_0152 [Isoptericola jiangsuensis]